MRSRRLPLEQLKPWFVDIVMPRLGPDPRPATSDQPLPLSWPALFGNHHPVEIEVGFGKGLFLVTAGQANPRINYFGIEIERKYALFTANRIAKRRLDNVRVTSCDARWLFREGVTAESVAAVHVYFPDPWWKQRHRKRRLFTAEFAAECLRALEVGGRLHLASDVEEYFRESAQMIAGLGFEGALEPTPAGNGSEGLTNFERKYRAEGRPIYRGQWRKK